MDISVIPVGMYCYSYTGEKAENGFPCIKMCPYWGKDDTKRPLENGFCTFLGLRDWDEGSGTLLWDAVKECNINRWNEDEY